MGDIEQESSDGNWLVTYSDLVTLLLVFFVLLYVLTPGIDQATFNNFISHFQASVSVIEKTNNSREEESNNSLREEWEAIKQYLEEQGLSSEVNIQVIKDGVKITLSDSLTFNSGSAKLLPPAKEVLERISGVLGSDVRAVKTQGHTDNVPIASTSRYRSNWHLGAARAVSVVLFMNKKSSLVPQKFEASSFGKYKPVTTNKTVGGRRKNRRVEIYVKYYAADQSDALKTMSN